MFVAGLSRRSVALCSCNREPYVNCTRRGQARNRSAPRRYNFCRHGRRGQEESIMHGLSSFVAVVLAVSGAAVSQGAIGYFNLPTPGSLSPGVASSTELADDLIL